MRAPLLIVAAIGAAPLLGLGVAAIAQTPSAALSAPPGMPPMAHMERMPGMSPDQMHARHEAMMHGIVDARQAGFKLTMATFLSLKAAIARGDDPKTMAQPAGAIAAWGKAIPAMFPPGSVGPQSRALPAIWTDRPGFEGAAANLATAATALSSLAKAGDAVAVEKQWDVVKNACSDCHTRYRAPDEKK